MAEIDLSSPRFEAILTQAVDRQLTEQRALQDVLAGIESSISHLREQLEAASADTQSLTQAILDLNAGLRENAQAMESRIASLATTLLEGLREMASTQQGALESLAAAVSSSSVSVRDEVRDRLSALDMRVSGLHDGLTEANEIAAYLRDQADDLDRILSSLAEVPRRLEGVLAQALRRALTVRAGLIGEAEKALERTLGPVEERVSDLVKELGSTRRSASAKGRDAADGPAEELRKLALRQVELSTRLEDLHSSLLAWFGDAEEQRRSRDEGLAAATDDLVPGAAPAEAAASRSKNRKAPQSKAKAKPKAAAAAKKTPARSARATPTPARSASARSTPVKPARRAAAQAEPSAPAKPKRTRRRNYIPV